MRTFRTAAGRIFLGKNSGNLTVRFRSHLITLVTLFALTAVCGVLQGIIELETQLGQIAYPAGNWLAAACDVSGAAFIAIAGYVYATSLILFIIGRLGTDTGANEEDVPA